MIGFRRGAADLPGRVGRPDGAPSRTRSTCSRATTDSPGRPDLTAFALGHRPACWCCRADLDARRRWSPASPAWSPDSSARSRSPTGRRAVDDPDRPAAPATPVRRRARRRRRAGRRTRRRSSTPPATELRTVAAAGGDAADGRAGRRRVGPVDWQPCVAGDDAELRVGRAAALQRDAATATTQADQPVDLPPPPCTDPAGRALSLVVVKAPEHGTLAGLRYTPAAGLHRPGHASPTASATASADSETCA